MKKTIVTLIALGSICAANERTWSSEEEYTLNEQKRIESTTIKDSAGSITSGYIITKTNGDTSPAWVVLSLDLQLTAYGAQSEHLLSFGANAGNSSNAYGFTIDNSGSLTFGRMGTDNITSTGTASTIETGYSTSVGSITLNTEYRLTLFSKASGDTPGRGDDNFLITLTDLSNDSVKEVTAAGFAMNGDSFANLRIGSNITDTTLRGTIKNVTITVPEPTTATLSLLALAGLAARRRRK